MELRILAVMEQFLYLNYITVKLPHDIVTTVLQDVTIVGNLIKYTWNL